MAGKNSLASIARPDATPQEVAEVLVQLDAQGGLPGPAQLRRAGITQVAQGATPTLLLVPTTREVWLGGTCIASLKRSKLLYRLFETIAVHGRAMDRSELYEHVWELPFREPHSDNSLYVALNRLRKQLDGLEIEVLLESRYALATPHAVVSWTAVSGDVQAAVRHNLPAIHDPLLGRADDLQAITDAFDGGARLVTLRGPGGVGKTRLATEYGINQAEGDPTTTRAVWFCDLTNTRTMEELLSQVARDTGAGSTSWQDEADAIDQLGAGMEAGAPMLLILDNLEQIVELTPDTVGAWLERVPGLRVLATSRERLRLPGEQVIVIGPLRLPQTSGLQGVTDSPAVALFVERAQAIDTGFALSDDNAADIQAIVGVLDGLPLAIELAAARASLIAPKHLAERLAAAVDDPLKPSPSYDGLLVADRRGIPDKTAALRGSIEWSWALLEPWEREAMCQLSVFRGGFYLESAEAILDLSDAPDAPRPMAVIGALIDQSLLHSRMVSGRLRFDMLTSIREYAAEQLEADSPSPAHMRHAAHFATMGTAAYSEEIRRGNAEDCQQFAVEIDNLRAGIDAALAAGDPLAADCTNAVLTIMGLFGPLNPALVPVDEVLQIPGVGLAKQSRIHLSLGVLMTFRKFSEEAVSLVDTACRLARESGDLSETAWAIGTMGVLRKYQGRLDEAMEMYEEALALHDQAGSRRGRGRNIANMATVYKLKGDLPKARQLYNDALAEHRACGDVRDQAASLAMLSQLDLNAARFAQARTGLDKALQLYRRVEDQLRQAYCLVTLGELARAEEDLDGAQVQLEGAIQIFRELGAHMNLSLTMADLGEVTMAQGDLVQADKLTQEALAIAQGHHGSVAILATGYLKGRLGLVRLRQDEREEARALFTQAVNEIGETHMARLGMVLCHTAELEALEGGAEAAQAALDRAQEIADAQALGPGSALRRELRRLSTD